MTERRLEDFSQKSKVSIEHFNIEESIMVKSIEEKVEDIVKESLRSGKLKFFTKIESVNSEIDAALEKAPSKSGGGSGKNYPDIRLLLDDLPVMIEVKGAPLKSSMSMEKSTIPQKMGRQITTTFKSTR